MRLRLLNGAPLVHRVPRHPERLGHADDAQVLLGHGAPTRPGPTSCGSHQYHAPARPRRNIVSAVDHVRGAAPLMSTVETTFLGVPAPARRQVTMLPGDTAVGVEPVGRRGAVGGAMTDALVARSRAGDDAAFAELAELHRAELRVH